MKVIKGFLKATIYSLFLSPEGGLSLPKMLALLTSGVATYKFIIMDSNDPLIWLVYLAVIGGHGVASKLFEILAKRYSGTQ